MHPIVPHEHSIDTSHGFKREKKVISFCEFYKDSVEVETVNELLEIIYNKKKVSDMIETLKEDDVNNPNSGRVMQKAGMKFEGILRQSGRNNQGIVDMAHYSIIKADR